MEFDDEEEGKEVFLNIPKGRVNCPSPSTPHLPSLEEDIRKANRDLVIYQLFTILIYFIEKEENMANSETKYTVE